MAEAGRRNSRMAAFCRISDQELCKICGAAPGWLGFAGLGLRGKNHQERCQGRYPERWAALAGPSKSDVQVRGDTPEPAPEPESIDEKASSTARQPMHQLPSIGTWLVPRLQVPGASPEAAPPAEAAAAEEAAPLPEAPARAEEAEAAPRDEEATMAAEEATTAAEEPVAEAAPCDEEAEAAEEATTAAEEARTAAEEPVAEAAPRDEMATTAVEEATTAAEEPVAEAARRDEVAEAAVQASPPSSEGGQTTSGKTAKKNKSRNKGRR